MSASKFELYTNYRSFLRMLKLCKLAVHKLYLEGGRTRCQGVLDYGLNLHWNIRLIQSSLIHYQIKHVKIYLIQICNWIHIKFHSLIDTSDLNRLDFFFIKIYVLFLEKFIWIHTKDERCLILIETHPQSKIF